jgi:hypothetical protein
MIPIEIATILVEGVIGTVFIGSSRSNLKKDSSKSIEIFNN